MLTKENSRPLVCKYYLQNKCSRGPTCFYSHQQRPTITSPMAPQNLVCMHYQRGSCRFGSQCRHLHPLERDSALAQGLVVESGIALGASETSANKNFGHSQSQVPHALNISTFGPCKFFEQGNCAKGAACSFPRITSDPKGQPNSPVTPIKNFGYSSSVTSKTNDMLRNQPVGHRPPCKFFGRGECMKGAGCQFLHILAEPLPSLSKPRLNPQLPEINNIPFSPAAIDLSIPLQQNDPPDPQPEYHALENDQNPASAAAAVIERHIFNCKVQFGPGASVRGIKTSFDSHYIVLSGLPLAVTQEELISLAEPFGALSSVVFENSSTIIPPSVRIEYAECAEATRAVDNLDNKIFKSTKLTARLDLRAVESGIGILLSRKVKISWYAPSIIAWAHYKTISIAKDHAKRLDGKTFDGRCISASFQTPGLRQRQSFSVEIKGLPIDVNQVHLKRFCGSSAVSLGSPGYDREAGIQQVRLRLNTLDSFDVLPADKTKTKITAFAHFSSSDAAEEAVKTLHGIPQPFLKNSPLWLEQVHSVKYNVPARQFATLRVDFDSLCDLHQNGCKMRYYDRDEKGTLADPVCIRIYGPDPKALGYMKIGLDNLLQGEVLTSDGKVLWDEYFDTSESEEFLQTINLNAAVFVKLDTRTRNLRIFGPDSGRARVRSLIIHQLTKILDRRHILPLKRDVLRTLLTGGLDALHELIGTEKILLDVVAMTLVVRGSPDEVHIVRRAVAAMQTSMPLVRVLHNVEADCPVCFCEATDPIQLTCGHIYCTPCLQHFLRSAIGPSFSSLRCVAGCPAAQSQKSLSCGKDIPYPIIRFLLSPTEESQLLEASFLAYIHSRPAEFHYCPTPDCKVVYRPTKEDTALQCSACLNRICGACHVEFHEGLPCAEYRDNLQGGLEAFHRWREENGIKPCPNCRADLEKAGGCNHMTCIRCRTHICWVCMDTFSEEDSSGGVYQHLRQKHGGFYD